MYLQNKVLFAKRCMVVVLFLISSCTVFANRNIVKSTKLFQKALEAYHSGQYASSQAYLQQSIQKDTLNVQAYLLLSDVSSELKNRAQRKKSLLKVLEISPEKHALVYKFLAVIYTEEGDYLSALEFWEAYKSFGIVNDSALVELRIEACNSAWDLLNNRLDIDIVHLDSSINTSLNEYWPLVSTNDSTIFFTRLITGENQYPYERLFFSEWRNGGWQLAEQLVIGENEKVNEGTMCLSADGSLLFFTACGRSDGLGSCDIFYMQKLDGKWLKPKNAGNVINTGRWEAQPSVSAYGDRLFFSSNRQGGFGENDIWMSEIHMDEKHQLHFDNPINIGSGVNSPGNDFSPFIHADDQTLYFASNGRGGLGQSDLYVSRCVDSLWLEAENLGYPINSVASDDGLVVSPSGQISIFSSDRKEAIEGSKDLFQFSLPDALQPKAVGYLKGFVYDQNTLQKLNSHLVLTDLADTKSISLFSSAAEGFIVTLKANHSYAFNVLKKGYLFYSRNFNLKEAENFNQATILNIYLEPIREDAQMVLKNIFFDFDAAELNPESYPELQKVILFLQLNPFVRIEISGHTDDSGSAAYNLQLSKDRANSIGDFLKSEIDSSRIQLMGYGASHPVDSNETEEGRRNNRRSELRILSN